MQVQRVRRTFWHRLYLPSILRGLQVTLRHMFRRKDTSPVTELFPESWIRQGMEESREQTRGWLEQAWSPADDVIDVSVDETIVEGSVIASRLTFRWTEGGTAMVGHYLATHRVADGRITEHWHFGTKQEA